MRLQPQIGYLAEGMHYILRQGKEGKEGKEAGRGETEAGGVEHPPATPSTIY